MYEMRDIIKVLEIHVGEFLGYFHAGFFAYAWLTFHSLEIC